MGTGGVGLPGGLGGGGLGTGACFYELTTNRLIDIGCYAVDVCFFPLPAGVGPGGISPAKYGNVPHIHIKIDLTTGFL